MGDQISVSSVTLRNTIYSMHDHRGRNGVGDRMQRGKENNPVTHTIFSTYLHHQDVHKQAHLHLEVFQSIFFRTTTLVCELSMVRTLWPAKRSSRLKTSLVPRPHPLMRRNGLVNEAEFLGWHTLLQQCNLATSKTFCGKPAHKKFGYSNGDE